LPGIGPGTDVRGEVPEDLLQALILSWDRVEERARHVEARHFRTWRDVLELGKHCSHIAEVEVGCFGKPLKVALARSMQPRIAVADKPTTS
jgi:hypothetical protein